MSQQMGAVLMCVCVCARMALLCQMVDKSIEIQLDIITISLSP